MPRREKQPCPHCGLEFERLWQHKCSAAVHSAASAGVGAEEASSSGKKASAKPKEKQPCPQCGRQFERLRQHKCSASHGPSADVANNHSVPRNETSTEDRRKKQPCPTCGREFERLWQHKCPFGSADTAENDGATGNQTSGNMRDKQPCPTCGKEFVRLWQHKCPFGSADTAENDSVVSNEASYETTKKQPCPTCGKEFVRLWQHKCPFDSPDTAENDGSAGNKASGKRRDKQPCPTCGKEFVRLWQHKCPFGSADTAENDDATGNKTSKNRRDKQPCPTCGKEFVRLWQHKCHADSSGSSPGDSGGGSWLNGSAPVNSEADGSNWESVIGNPSEERFAEEVGRPQLDEDTLSTKPSPRSTEYDHGGARPKVLCLDKRGDQDGSSEQDKQSVCKWCGKHFKRLYQHKCKAVSMPPPPPERRASSSEPLPLDQGRRGYRPVIDIAALEERAQQVMENLQLLPSSCPTSEAITFFDEEVKLLKKESHTVSHTVSRFREKIRDHLQESTGLQWDVLNSGSSYDGTKVARADEVDCMFIPHLHTQWLQMTCDRAPPGFCYLQLTSAVSPDDPCGEFLLSLVDEQNQLSSQRFREKVFDILKTAVEDERRASVDPDAKPDSPSYAVLLKAIPRETGVGGPRLDAVSMDLVPALKLDKLPPVCEKNLDHLPPQIKEVIQKAGFHVIPKKCPNATYRQVDHLLWRFSFSLAEKHLTKFADSKQRNEATQEDQDEETSPTCRKLVLRMLKRLLEIFKGVDNSRTANPKMRQLRNAVDFLKTKGGFRDLKVEKFTTFQIRTLLWTEIYLTCPGTALWDNKSRRSRFIHSLIQLKKMVSGQMHVPHFFIPDMNIMAEVPKREREFLYILFHIAKELF